MNKTKVMISGECQKQMQKTTRWPRGVCDGGIGSNSIQCTSRQKWVNKKCSDVKATTSKVTKSFICRGRLNPVTTNQFRSLKCRYWYEWKSDKFCYLGDMFSVD